MTRFREDIEGACIAFALIGCAAFGAALLWFVGSLVSFALYDLDLSLRLFGRIAALGFAGAFTATICILFPVVIPAILAEPKMQ